jgi:hypothetical protein
VIEVTQIRLLVVMPVPEDQESADASRGTTFTDQVNAILRFDGGWRLTMSGTDYPGAAAEGIDMGGAAGEPPVKEALESLARAAEPEPEPEEGEPGGTGAAEAKVRTHAEVLEFEVPEGSDTVQVRVAPEVVAEGGEEHVRVKVDDPAWKKDTGPRE